MVEKALYRPPKPTAYPLGMGQGALELGVMARVTKGLAQGGKAQPIGGTQILSNALGARGGATWQGNALPLCQLLNQSRGNWGNGAHPCQQKPPQPAEGPIHSNPDSGQRPASMRASQWTGPRETAPVICFLNPDLVAHLVGWSNDTPAIVDGQKVMAFINLVAHVSSISSGFCDLLTLEVHPLGQPLELEGMGGSAILYLGYIEVNLQIPGIKGYNEDILLLVIPTMTYSEKVPVMAGSEIIDWVMGMMTKGELTRETVTWKQAHFGAVMSESLPPQALMLQHPGVLPGWCLGTCSYHSDGYHSPIWNSYHPWQHRCLGTLHVGPCACRTSMRPPVTCFHCTNCHLWGVAPRVILSTNLPQKPQCLPHRSPLQGHCWQGCFCQSGTTGGSPSGGLRRACSWKHWISRA